MYKITFFVKELIKYVPGLHRLHLIFYRVLIKIIPKRLILKIDNQKILVTTNDFGVSRRLILFGEHVPAITNFIKNEIKDGMVVVDVGANIGFYTLLASKRVGDGKVYAFEPDPRCFDLLRENVQINNYENTQCIQEALAEKSGVLSIYLDELVLSSTTISRQNLENNLSTNTKYSGDLEVKKTTLDDYFKDINENRNLDFLKMNIQGAEGLVIAGAEETLKKSKNITVLTEFWISGLKACGTNPTELLLKIKSLGFELYPVKDLGEGFYNEGMDHKKYTIDNLINFVEDPKNQKHDGMHLVFKK